jgi:GNAT superfamily N-acetyltransferase
VSDPVSFTVRPTRESDLPHLRSIFRQTLHHLLLQSGEADAAEGNDPMCPLVPAETHHILATDPDQQWLAEVRNTPVAYVSSITRWPIWFLAGFWVLPQFQGGRIGRELLARAREAGERREVTTWSVYASQHLSAQALYIRMGMTPLTPVYTLCMNAEGAVAAAKKAAHLMNVGDASTRVLPVDSDSVAIVADLDRTIRVVPRPEDHRYWLHRPTRECILLEVAGRPAGYAYVTDSGRVGPLGALETRHLPHLLVAAIQAAGARIAARRAIVQTSPVAGGTQLIDESDEEVFLIVPGVNMTALRFLFDLGFRIAHFGTFMSSTPFGLFDRYAISGPGLL